MKTPAKKPKAKALSSLLRIGGQNTQVVQFMDYPDFNDPNGRHILVAILNSATLEPAGGGSVIFTGPTVVRINTNLTPAALAIITRLLDPFKGYFVMIVDGTYTVNGSYAEVQADDVPWTNIQPVFTKSKSGVQPVKVGP